MGTTGTFSPQLAHNTANCSCALTATIGACSDFRVPTMGEGPITTSTQQSRIAATWDALLLRGAYPVAEDQIIDLNFSSRSCSAAMSTPPCGAGYRHGAECPSGGQVMGPQAEDIKGQENRTKILSYLGPGGRGWAHIGIPDLGDTLIWVRDEHVEIPPHLQRLHLASYTTDCLLNLQHAPPDTQTAIHQIKRRLPCKVLYSAASPGP